MDRMGYAAAAIGEMDLYLGLDLLRSLNDMTKVRFLSANLTDNKGKTLFEPYRLIKAGDITVGVIGLTANPVDKKLFSLRMPGATVKEPFSAVAEAIEEIGGKCDLIVLLSNIGYSKNLDLADIVPGIDVIISGGSKRLMKRPVILNKTLVSSGFYQGRVIGRLLVHLDGDITGWVSRNELDYLDKEIMNAQTKTGTPAGKRKLDALVQERKSMDNLTRYESDMISLTPSFPDDPQVADMISDYRKSLKKGSVVTPGPTTRSEGKVFFTGSKECLSCHESRYRFWLTTDHSRAFESLAPKDAEADPDCIGCHVTGYKRRGGYWPKAPREDLRGVGCEACHGVGSLHVGSPDRYSLLHLPSAPQCMDCHTEDQDDDFNYLRERSLVCSEEAP